MGTKGEAGTRWVSAGFAVAVGIAMVVLTGDFPKAGQVGDPGAAAFPRLVGLGLVVLGILQGLRPSTADALPGGRNGGRVLAIMAALGVYSVVFTSVDYVLGGVLFVLVALLVAGERSVVVLLGVSLGAPLVTALCLVTLADVPLPSGPIGRMLF